MTARAKKIGTETFAYPLWVAEFEKPADVMSEMRMSASGKHIVYAKRIQTPYITLVSKEYGWLTEANVAALKAQFEVIDGTTYTLTYDDDTTETVRYAHEKGIEFTPLYEGACWYTATINLAVVDSGGAPV